MNDLKKLKEVLDNQAERGIRSGDWAELAYTVKSDDDGGDILRIESLEVGFKFSKSGRLIGGFNWKQ